MKPHLQPLSEGKGSRNRIAGENGVEVEEMNLKY
jgi:hypothetical protein